MNRKIPIINSFNRFIDLSFQDLFVIGILSFVIFLPVSIPASGESWSDLEVESIQIKPPRLTSEIPITAVASLRNHGSQPAENFHVKLSLYRDKKRIKIIQDIPVLSHLPPLGSGLSVPVTSVCTFSVIPAWG